MPVRRLDQSRHRRTISLFETKRHDGRSVGTGRGGCCSGGGGRNQQTLRGGERKYIHSSRSTAPKPARGAACIRLKHVRYKDVPLQGYIAIPGMPVFFVFFKYPFWNVLFYWLGASVDGQLQPSVRHDFGGAISRTPQPPHTIQPLSAPQTPREQNTGRQPPPPYRPSAAPQAARYQDPAGRQPLRHYQPLAAPQARRPAARSPARQVGSAPASRMGGTVSNVYNSMKFDVLTNRGETFRCQLHLVRPRNGRWDQETVSAFRNMVVNSRGEPRRCIFVIYLSMSISLCTS